jgi:2-keto-4-pentenoate hydratase/2-oxohepta-3-ene-1,7-dioic acid hydratase in catechol pathway
MTDVTLTGRWFRVGMFVQNPGALWLATGAWFQMRIARFVSPDGQMHTGRLLDEQTARPLTSGLWGSLELADESVAIAQLLAPVEPPNIFAIGRNYRAHIEETGARTPGEPLVFLKPTTSLLGPGGEIVLPASAPDEVDFEAELALVIGRTARNVPEQGTLAHVLGYTCANDISARDCQRNDKQWSRGKGFDTFCPLGPWLVTADELDPDQCGIRSRLNGRVMQESSTANMMYSCARLVSYLSHQFTLLPGTVILTGTPEGVGFTREPPVFLRDGDHVEIEVDGIGVLHNTVRQGRA